MPKYLFGGFSRCLYREQKFHSEPERKLAVILERDALKWFRPAKGQVRIYYRLGAEQHDYLPDFIAETADLKCLLEPKASNEMEAVDVIAKRDAAVEWCRHASDHEARHGGKSWAYVLVPHIAIAENITLGDLVRRFSCR